MGIPVDDPTVLLRAVRIGAFAPMLPAVPAPLAIEMGMSRGDGTVVAADAANVAAVGVAGLPVWAWQPGLVQVFQCSEPS